MSINDKVGVPVDAWKLYCEAWRECFPRSQLEPTLSPAALQIMVDKMLATGGTIYRAMAESSQSAERATTPEVWEVYNKVSAVLFATEEAAKRYVGSFAASVSGGLHIARRDVLGHTSASKDAVPVADIEAEIAHIKQNGIDVAKFGGQNLDEGRCRELCAMFLGEFIQSWRLQQRLDSMALPDSSVKP